MLLGQAACTASRRAVAFAGDLLFLYTDGVTGKPTRQGAVRRGAPSPVHLANRNLPRELQNALLDTVMAFGEGRQDD
jgi:serine phosphatase RsbU (regulator of sigma subunit)